MRLSAQESEAVRVHSEQAGLFRDRYEELAGDPYRSCFAYTRRRLHARLDALLPPGRIGARLLDLGCGTGHHLAWAHGKGYECSGVDGSEAMLAQAGRLNPGADLRLEPVDGTSFPEAAFDALLCVEVLRYLPDVRPCVHEIARVLKPGGTALVTASPLFNLSGYPLVNRLALRVPWGRVVRLKQFFHTSRGLRIAFRDAGFRHVTVHGVHMGVINWMERVAPRRIGPLLRALEPLDARLSDSPAMRDLSGMLLVHAER